MSGSSLRFLREYPKFLYFSRQSRINFLTLRSTQKIIRILSLLFLLPILKDGEERIGETLSNTLSKYFAFHVKYLGAAVRFLVIANPRLAVR